MRGGFLALCLAAYCLAAPRTSGEPPFPPGEVPPRLDRYGDPLPEGAVARLGTARFRLGPRVSQVGFFRDGKYLLAYGSYPGTLRVWEFPSGRPAGWAAFSDGEDHWAEFSPDANAVALGGPGNRVCLWDMGSRGGFRETNLSPEGASGLRLSRERDVYACSLPEGGVGVFETRSGKERFRTEGGDGNHINRLCFVPKGDVVAGLDQKDALRLWDVRTGKETRRIKTQGGRTEGLDFSPDGDRVVVWAEQEARAWRVSDGTEVGRFRPDGNSRLLCAIFSPDGRQVGLGDNEGWVRMWEPSQGRVVHRFRVDESFVLSLAFSPDAKILAVGSNDRLVLVNVSSGRPVPGPDGHRQGFQALLFSPAGDRLIAQDSEGPRLWALPNGRELRRFEDGESFFWGTALSPDGKWLAGGSKGIVLWDTATAKLLTRFGDPDAGVAHLAFSPDGKQLTSVDEWAKIQVWDLPGGREVRQTTLPQSPRLGRPRPVGFAPRGRRVVTSWRGGGTGAPTTCGPLIVWDAVTGKELSRLNGERDSLHSRCAFTPDGRLLAWAEEGANRKEVAFRVRDLPSGKGIRRIPGQVCGEWALAASPDGRLLAAASPDGPVELWELATGKIRRQLVAEGGSGSELTFTRDGSLLAVGYGDGAILLWDAAGKYRTTDAGGKADDALWGYLAGEDAGAADAAIRLLVAGGQASVSFLNRHLLSSAPVDGARMRGWIKDLDADDFDARRWAGEELARAGEQAEPAIRQALAGKPSAEVHRRLADLLEGLDRLRPETLRAVRAVETLEHIGSPEARRVLERLATGAPGTRLTREARESLERLARRVPAEK